MMQKGAFGLCLTARPWSLVRSWGTWSPSPAQEGEGTWKMWSRDTVEGLVESERNFLVFFSHLKCVGLC